VSTIRDEMWRGVVGYEGHYEVSDQGRVRSLRLRGKGFHGRYDRPRAEPLVLRPVVGRSRYPWVHLAGATRPIHHLVLEAFIGPCPLGQEASHLNRVRSDARLVNLVWETHAANIARRDEHGTTARGDRAGSRLHPDRVARGTRTGAYTHPERVPRGERVHGAKLTDIDVLEIRAATVRGESIGEMARRFGVATETVRKVIGRKTWTHVP